MFNNSKKGVAVELSLGHIIDLVIVGLVTILLISIYFNMPTEESIIKRKLAVDSALLIDAVSFARGNVRIGGIQSDNNTISVDNSLVVVGGGTRTRSFSFIRNPSLSIHRLPEIKTTGQIALSLNGSTINFGPVNDSNFQERSSFPCPNNFVSKPSNVTFIKQDDGLSFLVDSIKHAVSDNLLVPVSVFVSSVVSSDLPGDTGLIFWPKRSNSSSVRAFIPSDSIDSRVFACSIISNLNKEYPNYDYSLVPFDNDYFKNAKSSIILSTPSSLSISTLSSIVGSSLMEVVK